MIIKSRLLVLSFSFIRRLPAMVQLILLCTSLIALPASAQANPEKISQIKTLDTSKSFGSILQYHHVSNKTPKATSISPEQLEAHFRYLEKENFSVIPLDELVIALKNKQPLPEKTVAITFDDAYESIFENAYPLLKQRDWPFTIFVATDPIDLRYGDMLSWDQLRLMQQNGALIANHTRAHRHLTSKLPDETNRDWLARVEKDLRWTEQRIANEIPQQKAKAKLFAWPYGEFNQPLLTLLADMKYISVAQHSGPASALDDFSALPRFPASGRYANLNTLKIKLNSMPLPVSNLSQQAVTDTNPPLLSFDLEKGPYVARQLNCYGSGQGEIPIIRQGNHFQIQAKQTFNIRRFRYNCTLRHRSMNKYFWRSWAWVREDLPED